MLAVGRGESVVYRQVWYKGEVFINLKCSRERGLTELLWVMSHWDGQTTLRLYR